MLRPQHDLAARPSFLVCYASAFKVHLWIAYELTRQHLHGLTPRPNHFRHDNSCLPQALTIPISGITRVALACL
jgi:hypothetical protein